MCARGVLWTVRTRSDVLPEMPAIAETLRMSLAWRKSVWRQKSSAKNFASGRLSRKLVDTSSNRK
jgi:hypothetical protein